MKNSFQLTLFILVVLISTSLTAQSIEKDILDIRKRFNEINQMLDTLETKTIDELSWSVEGGDAMAYLNNGNMCMIRAKWFGETGKGQYDYYYSKGKLFFAFYTDYRYNRAFYYDDEAAKENDDEAFDAAKTVVLESRFYFKDRVLLRWLNESKEQVPKDDYGKKPEELLALSDELLKRFKE